MTYWSRDLSSRLFRLEYLVRLHTGAEIYHYDSSVWSTLFDYLLEQRFISTILPSGVPCSITYWSGDLSLRFFLSGVPCSITYWSGDLSLRLSCLEHA